MDYYIADTHFGHANIIRHTNRPFADVDEMNRALIENWNSRVGPSDDVYVIGDFAFRSAENVGSILRRLNGTKHLAIGNHDSKWMKTVELGEHFAEVGHALYHVDGRNRRVWMCHYPCMTWPGARYESSYHIYGHIHDNTTDPFWPLLRTYRNALNAGVEVNQYMPVTLDELVANNACWRESAAPSAPDDLSRV